jgi:hypothetical protein
LSLGTWRLFANSQGLLHRLLWSYEDLRDRPAFMGNRSMYNQLAQMVGMDEWQILLQQVLHAHSVYLHATLQLILGKQP